MSTRSVLGVRSRSRFERLPSISRFQTLRKRTAYFIMATEENTKVLDNLHLFIYSLLSKSPHLIYDPEALGTKLQILH